MWLNFTSFLYKDVQYLYSAFPPKPLLLLDFFLHPNVQAQSVRLFDGCPSDFISKARRGSPSSGDKINNKRTTGTPPFHMDCPCTLASINSFKSLFGSSVGLRSTEIREKGFLQIYVEMLLLAIPEHAELWARFPPSVPHRGTKGFFFNVYIVLMLFYACKPV